MAKRRFLDVLPLQEAQDKFFEALKLTFLSEELIEVKRSWARVTAEPVRAEISSPHYDCSAMDGVVVKSCDTYDARESCPTRLLLGGQARFIETGQPIPCGFDSVVMLEDVCQPEKGVIEINRSVALGQHVRKIGEDIVAGEILLRANHKVRPVDIGAMLSGGVSQIRVRRKPKVLIIPTGDELVLPTKKPEVGKIIESNSYVLGSFILEWGGEFTRHAPVRNSLKEIKEVILQGACQYDVVIINAGSSAGQKDFVPAAIEEAGSLLVHGIAIMPGKPTALGIVKERPVIGIPGYPVSAVMALDLFVKPLICKMLGIPLPKRNRQKAFISRKVSSGIGREEFLRVKLKRGDKGLIAEPLHRGAGVITSLVKADGIVRIPRLSEGIEAGQIVEVELWD